MLNVKRKAAYVNLKKKTVAKKRNMERDLSHFINKNVPQNCQRRFHPLWPRSPYMIMISSMARGAMIKRKKSPPRSDCQGP